jgi:hypothetical protein
MTLPRRPAARLSQPAGSRPLPDTESRSPGGSRTLAASGNPAASNAQGCLRGLATGHQSCPREWTAARQMGTGLPGRMPGLRRRLPLSRITAAPALPGITPTSCTKFADQRRMPVRVVQLVIRAVVRPPPPAPEPARLAAHREVCLEHDPVHAVVADTQQIAVPPGEVVGQAPTLRISGTACQPDCPKGHRFGAKCPNRRRIYPAATKPRTVTSAPTLCPDPAGLKAPSPARPPPPHWSC